MSNVIFGSNNHINMPDIYVFNKYCLEFSLNSIDSLQMEHLKLISNNNLNFSRLIPLYNELHLRGYSCDSKIYKRTFPKIVFPVAVAFADENSDYTKINFRALGMIDFVSEHKIDNSRYFNGIFLSNIPNIYKDIDYNLLLSSFKMAGFNIIEFKSIEDFNSYEKTKKILVPADLSECFDGFDFVNIDFDDSDDDDLNNNISNVSVETLKDITIINAFNGARYRTLHEKCATANITRVEDLSEDIILNSITQREQQVETLRLLHYFKRLIGVYRNECLILDVVNESLFTAFIKQCIDLGLVYYSQIRHFELKDLKKFNNLGEKKSVKLLDIITKFNKLSEVEQNSLVIKNNSEIYNRFSQIKVYKVNDTFQNVDLEILNVFGIGKPIIKKLKANNFSSLSSFNEVSSDTLDSMFIRTNKITNFLNIINEKSVYTCLNDLSFLKKKEIYVVYYLRHLGETLDLVSSRVNLTRERVRQISLQVSKKISMFLEHITLANAFIGSNIYTFALSLENNIAQSIIESSLDCNISGNKVENLYFLRALGIFVLNDVNFTIKKSLDDFVMNLEGIYNIDNLVYSFNQVFSRFGIGPFDKDIVLGALPKNAILTKDNVVCKGNATNSEVLCEVLLRFGDGVSFVKNSPSLIKYAEECGNLGIKLPDNWYESDTEIRNVHNRIESYSVLCGRRSLKHIKNVTYDSEIISEIYQYIIDSDDNIIFYKNLFEVFKDKLLSYGNVNNHMILHGLLKYLYNSKLSFNRDTIAKDTNNLVGGRSVEARIIQFLKDSRSVVTFNEIIEKFPGFELSNITQAKVSTEITGIGEQKLIYTGYLTISSEEEMYIVSSIDKQFNVLSGCCSVRKLYADCEFDLFDLYQRFRISGEYDFYLFLKAIFSDRYCFSSNLILTRLNSDISTPYDIYLNYFKEDLCISKAKLKAFRDEYIIKSSDRVSVLFENIVYENFKNRSDVISDLLKIINANLDYHTFVSSTKIQNDILEFNIDWDFSTETINAIVSKLIPEINIIPNTNGILTKSINGINNKSDMLRYVIDNDFGHCTYILFSDIKEVFLNNNIEVKDIRYFDDVDFIKINNSYELEVINEL